MDYSLPGSSVPGTLQQEYWSGFPFPSPNRDQLELPIKIGKKLPIKGNFIMLITFGKDITKLYNIV